MQTTHKIIAATATALSSILFCTCNFATQSFNLGKLLLPGESMTTVSYGKRSSHEIHGEYHNVYDSTGHHSEYHFVPTDTLWGTLPSYALDYRLGVLSKHPFGKGLEIGFLIEYPVQSSERAESPLLQFDGRLGLPMLPVRGSLYHHNVGLGWNVGMWADNSWFLEYAGGLERGIFIPYYNLRVTRTATDPDELDDAMSSSAGGDDIQSLSFHHRRWNTRFCAGLSMKLPRLPVVPDFIVPEVAVFYPNVIFRKPGFAVHIGARWLNGF